MAGISVSDMLDDCYSEWGCDTDADSGIPEADALSFLNRAFWQIADNFEFREKEKQYSFSTVAGTRQYNMPSSFEALQLLSIVDPITYQHTQLKRMEQWQYENEYNQNTTTPPYATPISYYREDTYLVLFPTPDQVYTVNMKYLLTLSDLENDDSIVIPRAWHEAILQGGKARGFQRLRQYDKATWYLDLQRGFLETTVPTESKEEVDSTWAGLKAVTSRENDPYTPYRRLWR